MADSDASSLWSFRLSPFVLTYEEYAGYSMIDEIVNSGSYHFYRIDMSLIGALCILGAVFGLFGWVTDRCELGLAGGALVLLSTLLFPTCLPGYLPKLSVGWGGYISALGALVLMASVYTGLSLDRISSYVKRGHPSKRGIGSSKRGVNERNTSGRRRDLLERIIRFQLELMAMLGSIYSGYELSRILYSIFSVGSITIGLGNQPLWLYRVEMFICLYAAIYWSVKIVKSLLGHLIAC